MIQILEEVLGPDPCISTPKFATEIFVCPLAVGYFLKRNSWSLQPINGRKTLPKSYGMTFRLFAHLGWHHLPLEEMLLVGRQASSFSSFPVLVLPCAFSHQLKITASSQPEDLSCLLMASESCRWLPQLTFPLPPMYWVVVLGVPRCTGTKCEPSKLLVCFGQ